MGISISGRGEELIRVLGSGEQKGQGRANQRRFFEKGPYLKIQVAGTAREWDYVPDVVHAGE